MFSNFTAIFDLIEKLCFTEKLKQTKMMANQDETIQERLTERETPQDHQGETHLYEPVDEQPETSVCVIGTNGQGHNENGEVNEDQEGYLLPINRQHVTYISVIENEGQGHYENRENEDQDGYLLPMDRKPEISICGTETEGQGHYENGENEEKEGYVPMKREVNDQDGYVLPMNRKPEICMGVIEPESQGHYENRGVNKDQDGYEPMNREVMTLTQSGATNDNIHNYENSPFYKNDKKNDYEGLQITRDEHPYADI